MKDVFNYQSPMGFLGRIFNNIVLTKYLTKFLVKRNDVIKEFAETDKWKLVLTKANY
jgi:hypothetical protein